MKICIAACLLTVALTGRHAVAGAAADAARQAVVTLEEQVTFTERMVKMGVSNSTDLARVQQEVLEARILLAQAEGREQEIPALLEQLLQIESGRLVRLQQMVEKGVVSQDEVRTIERNFHHARLRLAESRNDAAAKREALVTLVEIETKQLHSLNQMQAAGVERPIEVARQQLVLARARLALEQQDAK